MGKAATSNSKIITLHLQVKEEIDEALKVAQQCCADVLKIVDARKQ